MLGDLAETLLRGGRDNGRAGRVTVGELKQRPSDTSDNECVSLSFPLSFLPRSLLPSHKTAAPLPVLLRLDWLPAQSAQLGAVSHVLIGAP